MTDTPGIIDEIKSVLKIATSSFDELVEQISAFFDSLPDPVFVINQEGLYVKVLGGKARHLYQDGSYLEGKSISDIFSSESTDKFLSAIKEAIEKDSLVCVEYEINPSKLSKLPSKISVESAWYEGRIYPIKNKSTDLRSVIWYTVNITKRKLLEEELKLMAETDPLTGAYNRRYFMKAISKEFSLSKRYHSSFSFLIMDIDFFKRFNDSYGHDVGDMVLKELVDICAPLMRDVDLFARFGGEEFVVILPNTAIDGAFTIAERIRKEINEKKLKVTDNEVCFSVSIGISEVSISDQKVEDVIKRADQALYEAKESGRNRVCSH